MDMPPKKKLKKRPKAGATHEAPKPLIIDEGLEQQELEFDGRKALRHNLLRLVGCLPGRAPSKALCGVCFLLVPSAGSAVGA